MCIVSSLGRRRLQGFCGGDQVFVGVVLGRPGSQVGIYQVVIGTLDFIDQIRTETTKQFTLISLILTPLDENDNDEDEDDDSDEDGNSRSNRNNQKIQVLFS